MYMERTRSIADWISEKPPRGRYTFTHDEVVSAFPDMAAGTMARALTREVSKGRIISPLRGFYVIVPEEYRLRGTVPQSVYMDDMMRHLGRKYYVALLSAAQMHGAAHQAPMTYCVMIEPPTMRDKKGDRYQTQFFCKSHIQETYLEKRQTRTGYLWVSSPELTAVDLITYQAKVGSVTRAATVLAELVEKTDFGRLGPEFVETVPVSSLQRLGYILDEVLEEQESADAVYDLLKRAGVHLQAVALKAGKGVAGCEKNEKWKVMVNVEIEIDEL
jgi:predicted transcriptional regulator of viral defense system